MALTTLILLAFLYHTTPNKDAIYRHHEIVTADATVGVDAASEVDDGIECRHQQTQWPEPPVCPIFTNNIEQTDDGTNDFNIVH